MRRRRRASIVAVAAVLLLVVPAGPASADDIFEIDGRLQEAGFELAYTVAYEAVDRPGVRIVVDYDSDSQDEAAYQREAEQAAELVWDHLEGRVLAVDVAPTYDVPWSEEGLPSALSFDRAGLAERFGARPAALDGADVETVDDVGLVFVGAVGLAWLLSLVAVGVGTFFVTRRRYRRDAVAAPPAHWGGWSGQAVHPATPPQSGTWPPPPVPGQWPPAPPAPSAPAEQQPPQEPTRQDPWRPLR